MVLRMLGGVTSRSRGYSPRALEAPMAWPMRRPPPAIMADMIERIEQAAAVARSVQGDAAGQAEVGEGFAAGGEGAMGHAEIARLAAARHAAQADERWNVGVVAAAQPGQHAAEGRVVVEA